MVENEKRRPKKKKHVFGRLMAFLGLTLLCVILTLAGVVWVALRGPSPTMTGAVCNSLRETSALRWIPGLFLSEEELDSYLLKSTISPRRVRARAARRRPISSWWTSPTGPAAASC